MNDTEKARKFDEIVSALWDMAVNGNTFQSTIATTLIRTFSLTGPNGEDPESA